jgi:predicted TIM-barrel fold metal-dependent hydrolase
MTVTDTRIASEGAADAASGQRYLIVSTDSHVGPSLAVLREYCPKANLETYDSFTHDIERRLVNWDIGLPPEVAEAWEQSKDEGVNDPQKRLANMDADGIASEVIFHGAGYRGVPMPFISSDDRDLEALGKRIYNRWLADFCAADRQRLLAVAELPWWDIDESVKEMKWAAENGFRAVNFSAPRADSVTYDDPAWEPYWNAAEEYGLSLNCHAGVKIHGYESAGVSYRALYWAELHFVGHSSFAMMCFGGVFDRHPKLHVIFNEQRGFWVAQQLRELDAIYDNPWNRLMREEIHRRPSEYWRQNCFIGGSFLARFELGHTDEVGLETFTWGRDYPHLEGTWPFSAEALRATFSGMKTQDVRTILGDNGIRCYGLDSAYLRTVADRIGPEPATVAQDLEATPADAWSWAFRDRDDNKGGKRIGGSY